MNSICREVEGRLCTECCDAADCLDDYSITKVEAIKTLKSAPEGEFFASILFNSNT